MLTNYIKTLAICMTLHIASRDVGDIVNSYQQYQTVAAIKRGFWVGGWGPRGSVVETASRSVEPFLGSLIVISQQSVQCSAPSAISH